MTITAEPIIVPQWWDPEELDEEGDISGLKVEKDPNVFKVKIKALNSVELLEVRNHLRTTLGGYIDFTAKGLRVALELGLLDWMNFRDLAEGTEVPFSIANAYNRLPYNALEDIAYQIITRSSVPESARKKS